MIGVYTVLAAVGVIIILSFMPITAIVDFAYKADNTIYIKFLFMKFALYPSEEKAKADTNKAAEAVREYGAKGKGTKKIKRLYRALKKDICDIVGYFIKKAICVKEINISARIGTGDAMYTGILYGSASAAVFGFLGAADSKMKIQKFNVDIKPDFDNEIFSAGMYIKVRTRIIYLYYPAVKGICILHKAKKILNQ